MQDVWCNKAILFCSCCYIKLRFVSNVFWTKKSKKQPLWARHGLFWPLASPPKPFFHFRKQENHLTNKDEARRPSSNATFTFGPSLLAPAIRRFRYVWNFSISRGPLHEGSIREAVSALRFWSPKIVIKVIYDIVSLHITTSWLNFKGNCLVFSGIG